jgi:hypothetical protein
LDEWRENAGRFAIRYGYEIYLTEERWEHIIDPENHPEMEAYEDELIETLRSLNRLQEPLNPQKYRYSKAFADLTAGNTHIVAIVLCRFRETSIAAVMEAIALFPLEKELLKTRDKGDRLLKTLGIEVRSLLV